MLQRGALLYSNVALSAKALNKTTKQSLRAHRLYRIHISSWVIKSRDPLLCLSACSKERLRRDGGGADDCLLDSTPCFTFSFLCVCVSVLCRLYLRQTVITRRSSDCTCSPAARLPAARTRPVNKTCLPSRGARARHKGHVSQIQMFFLTHVLRSRSE